MIEQQQQPQGQPQQPTDDYVGVDDLTQMSGVQRQDPTIAQLQLDAETMIEDYKNELIGVARNKDGDLVQIDMNPLVNIEGANKLVPFVRQSLAKTVTLGKLKKSEINNLMFSLGNEIAIQLVKNYKEYGIRFSHLTEVSALTKAYMQVNYSRAEDGFTSKLIGRQMSINEVRHVQTQQKKGLFG